MLYKDNNSSSSKKIISNLKWENKSRSSKSVKTSLHNMFARTHTLILYLSKLLCCLDHALGIGLQRACIRWWGCWTQRTVMSRRRCPWRWPTSRPPTPPTASEWPQGTAICREANDQHRFFPSPFLRSSWCVILCLMVPFCLSILHSSSCMILGL